MLSYLLLTPLIYFLAYLPTPLLLRISDFLAFIFRDIIRYRKKIIERNLLLSFPEKTDMERQQIAMDFYTHLSDRVIENIRCIAIPRDEFLKRCTIPQLNELNRYHDEGRHIVVLLAHCGAWEWAGYSASALLKHKIYGVYAPVTNPYFNKLVVNTRAQYGMHLISMRETGEYFKQSQEEPSLHIFFTDQSPKRADNAYWTNFLNQDTPFFYGGARYAIAHNAVVLYIEVAQKSRGFFETRFSVITEQAREMTEDQIVQIFAEKLEGQIRKNPSDWLWSHKRWKHIR